MKAKLLCDIVEPACGDHPELIIAKEGEEGELIQTRNKGHWGAYIRLDGDRVIGVREEEIERL